MLWYSKEECHNSFKTLFCGKNAELEGRQNFHKGFIEE